MSEAYFLIACKSEHSSVHLLFLFSKIVCQHKLRSAVGERCASRFVRDEEVVVRGRRRKEKVKGAGILRKVDCLPEINLPYVRLFAVC